MNNVNLFVNADLLLQENLHEKLRDFVGILDLTLLDPNFYHIIDSTNNDDGEIFCSHSEFLLSSSKVEEMVNRFIKSGYILMDIVTFKKLLGM